jgi:hypothetical protein
MREQSLTSDISQGSYIQDRLPTSPYNYSIFDTFFLSLIYLSRALEDAFFEQLGTIFGRGISFFALIAFVVYTFARIPRSFNAVLRNQTFIVLLLFILLSALIEQMHPDPVYRDTFRSVTMMVGMVCYAAWVYDNKSHLLTMIYGFIVFSLIHSLNFVLFISINDMLAIGDSDASRALLVEKSFFFANANEVGILCGTSMMLCLFLNEYISYGKVPRVILNVLAILFLYTVALSLSRSAFLNLGLLLVVAVTKLRMPVKGIHYFIGAVIGITLLAGIGQAVAGFLFDRFDAINIESAEESTDSRSKLYVNLYNNIDEVFLWGVGEGGYFGEWGKNSSIAKSITDEEGNMFEKVPPAHNSIAQILFYWGIVPVLLYGYFIFLLFRNLFHNGMLSSKLVYLLFCSTFVVIMFSNNFNSKDLTMIFGSVIGLSMYDKFRQTTPAAI